MGTLLRTHNRLELFYPLHGLAERHFLSPSINPQNPNSKICSKKSSQKKCKDARFRVSSSAILDLVPETKKELLEFDLPLYDPSKAITLDLVVGGGPAGLAVAQQVSEAGLSVVSINPRCYGLARFLYARNARIPTFLYAMPFSSNKIFLEEASLVARPGLKMEDIQERMVERLKHLGIRVKSIEEDERCVIPMGGPLPILPQRVVGIGGTAGMVHPSTGYMVARTFAAAPIVANSIVRYLGSDCGRLGHDLSAEVWKDLWPIERRRQREFFCFGMDVLLKLDLEGTRRFFDAFFDLEPRYWHGFLSSRLFLPELLFFGLSLFSHASNTSRLEIMAKGTLPLANMISNLVRDRD